MTVWSKELTQSLQMHRLENYGRKLSDESFHERIRLSFQAMGLPAPDIAQSFKLRESFTNGLLGTFIRKLCCCGSSDPDETSHLVAGGGKRKALYHLTVRINKITTRMEKTISGYYLKREELAPVKGKMLVSWRNRPRTNWSRIDLVKNTPQSTSKSYADGPVIRACVKSLV